MADDIDRILNTESTQLQREEGVQRVLKAFRLNPYEIMGLDFLHTGAIGEKDINKAYRKMSLLIHPDKVTDERKKEEAISAFSLLKQASTDLLDPGKKTAIDEVMRDARMLVLRDIELPESTPDDDPKVLGMKDPDFRDRVRLKAKEIMIDDELRKRRLAKIAMKEEGEEARKAEKEMEKRKRKAEEDKHWEETREERVSGWRNFAQKKKKKKSKIEVLG